MTANVVRRLAGMLLMIVSLATPAMAQTSAVSGVVRDERRGQPLAGVLVYADGHATVVETDADGRFTIDLPPGPQTIVASRVGYAVARRPIEVGPGAAALDIRLPEGAGHYAEQLTVAGERRHEAADAVAGAVIHGRDLESLRGVTLDDPLRAAQALPSATSGDDFYSEFAVRGSTFRHVGFTIDGLPARFLMHAVHGATDGGSIAMVNSETLGAVALRPGSYPQRIGRTLGAQLDLTTRDGERTRMRGRAGLSGTSANVLLEGPLAGGRGAWVVSGRRSYLDLLLKQIDPDGSFGFGFTDAQAKLTFDVTPRHHLQLLTVAGRSDFDEGPEGLGANEDARAASTSWLSALTWRFTPSPAFSITQRVYGTGIGYRNQNRDEVELDRGAARDLGWRADAMYAPRPGWIVEFGGDGQHTVARDLRRRLLDAGGDRISAYDASAAATSVYAQLTSRAMPRIEWTAGGRADLWTAVSAKTFSPWAQVKVAVSSRTDIRAGAGVHRQFPTLDQLHGLNAGRNLQPERASHLDAGIVQDLWADTTLQITWYARDERDILWARDAEPRRLRDGTLHLGRADAPWVNALSGRARGIEVVLRRDAAGGISGWLGYAYGTSRYTDVATGESFWGDADQRHTLSAYARYALSSKSSVGAKFRYGSNYPMTGYITRETFPNAPALFGDLPPLFYAVGETRNAYRLPAYARLDIRADRAITLGGRRITLFAEVANALNRANVRNVPFGFDPTGRINGATQTMMPIVPSGGFVIEF